MESDVIGQIKGFSRPTKRYVTKDIDDKKISFVDYTKDSSEMTTYIVFRKDFREGKTLKIDTCNVFKKDTLIIYFKADTDSK
jgi:hypothetical protein